MNDLSLSPLKNPSVDSLHHSGDGGSEKDELTGSSNSCGLDNSPRRRYRSYSNESLSKISNNSFTASALLMTLRGEHYYRGVPDKQDYIAAFACFKHGSNQTGDGRAAAWSNFYLGEMFYLGRGVSRDNDIAHAFWKLAVKQHYDPVVSAKAAAWVGQLYYKVGMATSEPSVKNKLLQAAFSSFRYVINNPYDEDALAIANLRIGMLYEDGEGTACDYASSQDHYKKAAQQKAHYAVSLTATLCLCDMAYAAKDYRLALQYCTPVAEQQLDQAHAAKAKLRRGVLYLENRYGIKRDVRRAYLDLHDVAHQMDDLDAAAKAILELEELHRT